MKAAVAKTKPYTRDIEGTNHHILVMGDSSMYSAGVKNSQNTVGGLLAAKYSHASVETVALNGAKVKDLEGQLNRAFYERYDLIVIGVGGNDIVQLSSYYKLRQKLVTFLKRASKVSYQIVLCHSVNIGNIGFFPFPLNYLFDYRSRKLSELFCDTSSDFPKVIDIIFYMPLHKDHYDKHNRKEFVASDGYHATDYANKYFFELIWKELQKSNKNPDKA